MWSSAVLPSTRFNTASDGHCIGFTIGKQQQSTDAQNTQTTAAASTVGVIDGNVNLNAGQTYTQRGSDVLAPGGDVNISAQRVMIEEAREAASSQTEQRAKQSGLTVAVNVPIVQSAQALAKTVEASDDTKSERMQALGAATAALQAKELADQAAKLGEALAKGTDIAQAADISVSVSLGSSRSQSNSSQSSDSARGSSVTAGGDVNITARGAGTDSDITIQGSQIKAGDTTRLSAEDEVKLLAARNTQTEANSQSSKSGSVGVNIATTGISATASASRGQGQGAGDGTTFTNAQVSGQSVQITSGADTTLKGAVVQGDQVALNVGGKLTIESLQDSSRYQESSKNAGFSVSVPITGANASASVSAGKTNINSNYQSVNEQSAIRAGDGGFQVSVAGNTTLTGGQITSSDKAVQDGKNTFSTAGQTAAEAISSGALKLTDLNNSASFEASGVNIGVGVSRGEAKDQQGNTLRNDDGSTKLQTTPSHGVSFGNSDGAANSATVAAISGLAGNTAARTGDVETGIQPIFNKDEARREVNAQVAITSEFGKRAPKLVADFTQTQRETIKLQALQAEQAGDVQAAKRLRDEAARWDEGGAYHVGLQALTGALSGGTAGALGAASVAAAAPLIEDITSKLPLPEPLQAVAGMVFASVLGAATGGNAGAAMGFNVDANNRSLHESERRTAIALAKASGGKYSVDEIVAQLRQMPNLLLAMGGDKDAATGAPELYANMNDPATQARWEQERKDDPNMPVNVQGVSMMERQSPANGELQAFIVSATTFANGPLAGHSPYVMTPSAAVQVLNQAAAEQRANAPEQPRYHGCATTECLLMGANYNANNPQNRAELERREGALKAAGVILSGPALVAAAATPQGQAALQMLLWNQASATGAAAGAGANAAVQYATTGKVDPAGVVVGAATGALGAGAVNVAKVGTESLKLIHGAGVTSAVAINAAGASVTNSQQGPTAVGSVAGYGVGQLPIPGAPFLGAAAQELLTLYFSTPKPPPPTTETGTNGGQ